MTTIKIGGELESTATGNIVAAASAIKDKTKNKTQGVINAEVDDALNAQGRKINTLEEAVGTGGSVDSRIATAKSEIIGDAASEYNTLGKLEDKIQAEATRAQDVEALKANSADVYTKTELNNMITTPNQQYVSVTANSQTTAVTDVLPATGAADTTYRVGNWDGTQYNDSVFSEYAWNGSAYIKLNTKSQVGEVYDISANHADTKYADLAAALGTNGANIPQNLRKGGMSVKFVQSSDNKYVQYRYMGTAVIGTPNPFLDTANWQGIDDEPTAGSDNLVKSGGVEKSIKIDTINKCIIARGKNLFDKSQELTTGRIDSDGSIDTSITAFRVSDYISVNSSTNYAFTSGTGFYVGNTTGYVAFYNENFQLIGTAIPAPQTLYFTTPNNCKYIRCSIHKDYDINYVQLEEGTTRTTYKAYDDIEAKPIVQSILTCIGSLNSLTTEDKTSLVAAINEVVTHTLTAYADKCNIARGKNLYDKNQTLKRGKIESDGHIDTSITAIRYTDYIQVKSSTSYVFTYTSGYAGGSGYIAFYDENLTLLGTVKPTNSSLPFTTPNNCKYIRCSVHSDYLNMSVQLEEGISRTSYEEYDDIARKTAIVNIKALIGNLSSLTTSQKDSIVNAINSLVNDNRLLEVKVNNKLNIYPNKNLFDKNQNFITGRIESDGTINTDIPVIRVSDYILVEPSTTYVFTEGNGWYPGNSGYIAYYDSNLVLLGTVLPTNANLPFSTPNNCKYIRVSIHRDYSVDTMQLEKGTARTSYVAYNPFGYYESRIATLENDNSLLQQAKSHKFVNPKFDYQKSTLKILDIGNSHSFDTLHYIARVVNAQNVDVSNIGIYRLARGGSSFKSWYDCWNNEDTSAYYLCKELGGLDITIDNATVPTYPSKFDGSVGDGELMRKTLMQNKFDLVIIHASFEYQDDWSVWEGDGPGGYLKELIRIIRTYQPKASVGYLFTHAPYGISGNSIIGSDELTMKFVKSIKQFSDVYGVEVIIPAGMAIQNIRQSTVIDAVNHHGLNYDKASPLHCGFGVATYVTSCTFYETILAPRFGKSILGNTYRTVVTTDGGRTLFDGEHIPDGEYSYEDASIPVTDDNAAVCQMSAILAANDFWDITNPDNITI